MADALPSAGLIKLQKTEHLGVTDQGKTQPQQKSGREKQSAKGSPNCFEGWPLAIVRPFQRQQLRARYRCAPTPLTPARSSGSACGRSAARRARASLRLLVGTAFSPSAGRSRNRQQDECREELCILLPPTNFRQHGDSSRAVFIRRQDLYKRYRIVFSLTSRGALFHENDLRV